MESETNKLFAHCEVCILAGGLSSRLGRDKSRVLIGRRSLISYIRATVSHLGMPVRVIRRDSVPRCGPLGGIFTALGSSRFGHVIFLSCDMPFVTERLVRKLLSPCQSSARGIFFQTQSGAGFPFLIRTDALPTVARRIAAEELSLQGLAKALRAKIIPSLSGEADALLNINTERDLARGRTLWKRRFARESEPRIQ